jgi:1-acyl-sn-glycerol-3-phosphate acyltransferase
VQKIIIEKPYKFIPPHRGNWLPTWIRDFNLFGRWLRKNEGIERFECRNVDRLRRSLDEGHGVLMTPNHPRIGDPLVMGWLAREADCLVYAMASWHLFNQGRFMSWVLPKIGAFSVNREGLDRKALNTAIDSLAEADRPLVIFPEGSVTRTNGRLSSMLDGVAFIARAAAKKRHRENPPGKVFVHPIAFWYVFHGDLEAAADKVLSEIEERFSYQPQRHLPLRERVCKVGEILLESKEKEYFGSVQQGELAARLQRLIDRVLGPLEEEWLGEAQQGEVVPRIKKLRLKIVPEMVRGELDEPERQRRWGQLADIYLSQQIGSYPPDYLDEGCSRERLLETIERFEEDLTDQVTVHGNLEVIIDVGERIEVEPQRDRSAEVDPLMLQIEQAMGEMLIQLAEQESEAWPAEENG